MGEIKNINDVDIESLKLCYKKGGENKLIFGSDGELNLLINMYGSDALFPYNDLKYVMASMFIEITYDDGQTSVLELQLTKAYSNDKLFVKNTESISQSDINEIDNKIPQYIKDNFTYSDSDRTYILEETTNGMKIIHTYFYEAKMYMVEEFGNDHIYHYEYCYPDDFIYEMLDFDGKTTDEFSYNIGNDKCLHGTCDVDIIDQFIENYLDKINFDE